MNKIYRGDEEEMTIAFLKEGDYNYNFAYSNDEERFDISCGGGGDALIEDILNTFDWNIDYPFWAIGDCFNISDIKHPKLLEYMQRYPPINNEEYSIHLSKELSNKEFPKLLKLTGVMNIISTYINALQNLLISNKSPLF